MSVYHIRSLHPADEASVMALLKEALIFDEAEPAVVRNKIWHDPDFDEDLNIVALRDGEVIGILSAVVRSQTMMGFVKVLAVDSSCRLRGVPSMLLGSAESQMIKRGIAVIRVGESAPEYWWPGVDHRYTAALLFFERKGYRRFGETHNMTLNPQSREWLQTRVPNVLIRRATPSDMSALMNFLQEVWPSWQYEARQCFENHPISLHLAFIEDRIVGFSAYDASNPGTGWFGPMGVNQTARGSGIGRELLFRCLEDFKRQGLSNVTIPWVGPLHFYSRLAGAAIERSFYRLEKKFEDQHSS